MSYRFVDSLRAGSRWNCSQAVSKPVWHIPLLCVQWKTPDDGQRNCPKHVEFYSKNKFEKLVHLVGFIIRIRTSLIYQNSTHNEWNLYSMLLTWCMEHHIRNLNFCHMVYLCVSYDSKNGGTWTFFAGKIFKLVPQIWSAVPAESSCRIDCRPYAISSPDLD